MSRTRTLGLTFALVALSTASCLAEGGQAFTDPNEAGPDFAIQGEYVGDLKTDDGSVAHGAQIVALGEGKFHAVLFTGGLPGEGWEGRFVLKSESGVYPSYGPAPESWQRGQETDQADGALVDGAAVFENPRGKTTIKEGVMTVCNSGGEELGQLKRVVRESHTLGKKPPEGAVVLFDGSSAEHFEGGRLTEDGLLAAGCASKQSFRDFDLHLEFRCPFMPASREQGRGNSGMYLQDRYEVQVLDSFGLEGRNNECGGLYSLEAPRLNMSFPPLSWQTYDAEFTAARFDNQGNKTNNAVLTLCHNGVVIYDQMELPGITPGGASSEAPGMGPLKLQDHGNPVHYRNIWVAER